MVKLSQKGSNYQSYSDLISQITEGQVDSLILNPSRREVYVIFSNGNKSIIPVFPNDQNLLRVAQLTRTPLTVRDIKQEQAIAGITGNLALLTIVIIGVTFLLKKSASVANRTLGFGRSQERIKPEGDIKVFFDDVAGLSSASEELKEIVCFLRKPEKLISLGARIPKGILLIGPPGTGKTLLAKAISCEAEVPFFSIAASEFVELFVGVGASRVRDLFRKAKEKAPCIIFIDEIDAVGRQRGSGLGGGNDEREQTLNQLLTEMDGFAENSGVILLAATNRPDVLDSALTRPGRFDRSIYLSLPDRKARKAILAVHARSKPLSLKVSLDDWATKTPGFSGAELANLLNEAAIVTARTNQLNIEDNHIERALERISMGIASTPLQDSSQKRLIAYHEIGHALAATFTPLADKIDKVSLLPREGGIGGYTRFWPDEEVMDSGLISKGRIFAKIIVALGGRAAESIVFGNSEVTQGASSDFEHVTYLAREMVTKFGFSSLGPQSTSSNNNEVFLGRDLVNKRSKVSEATNKKIDKEIRKIAFEAFFKVESLLKSKRALMDKLVAVLLEEEIIESKRFYELIEDLPNNHAL